MSLLTRRLVIGALIAPSGLTGGPSAFAEEASVRWTGKPQQGGFVIVRGPVRGAIYVSDDQFGSDSSAEKLGVSGPTGLTIIGFDRGARPRFFLSAPSPVNRLPIPPTGSQVSLDIAPVAYDVQRIDGLPADQVEPSDPALLARIKSELARKSAAMASRIDTEDFKDGFTWPLEHAIRTSKFGPQRILNGVPKTPHYGVDLAAPSGTPIRAPAPGLVVFADPAMHFEGGLTLIDHGQGLISAYLHQSAQSVRAGERVVRGQEIGRVGATGRATGPHLCWRLTWRGRHMDPSLMVGASAPA